MFENPENKLQLAGRILAGNHPLPDHLYIGDPCRNGHDINGHCVRDKRSRSCIVCEFNRSKKREARRLKKTYGLRNHNALEAYDNRNRDEDYDPLFD